MRHFRLRRAVRRIGWIAVALGLAACDDPTRDLEAPTDLDRSMELLVVLDPGFSSQPIWIETVDVVGDPQFHQPIEGVVATVSEDGQPLLRAEPDTTVRNPYNDCVHRYGALDYNSDNACIRLDFRPVPGRTYTITVTAPGRLTASGSTRIPGDFEILEADAAGLPPGSEGLRVGWSGSAGAYRYFVALQADSVTCPAYNGCLGEWYAATPGTELEARVPESDLREGVGPWTLDVYALDRALFEYLTTGTGEVFFSVPPVSSVEGGSGVVGSWIRRSWRINN